MAQSITTKELRDVRTTLAGGISSVYAYLKSTFSEREAYTLFAEPAPITDTRIAWYTELSGKPVPFSKLSESELRSAEIQLQQQVKGLLTSATQYQDSNTLKQLIENCVKVPSWDDVYQLYLPNGEPSIVLTQWSYTANKPDAEAVELWKIIYAIRIPMIIRLAFNDGSPASNREVWVEYEGIKETHRTDTNGLITLANVKVDSNVKAYIYNEKGDLLSEKNFVCYSGGKYLISIEKPAVFRDMRFKFISHKKQAVKSLAVDFKQHSESAAIQTYSTDSEGRIVLSGIKVGTQIDVGLPGYTVPHYQYLHQNTDEEHVIELPVLTSNATFKVFNIDKKPYPNVTLTLRLEDGQQRVATTDSEGRAVIENIPNGSTFTVKATPEKRTFRFTHTPEIAEYTIYYYRRWWQRWWVWLLLGLMMLSLLALGWFYIFRWKIQVEVFRVAEISLTDTNNRQDDFYDLYVNGKRIGAFNNKKGGSTIHKVSLNPGLNKVELKLTKKNGGDTGAELRIKVGEQLTFSNWIQNYPDSKGKLLESYNWSVQVP